MPNSNNNILAHPLFHGVVLLLLGTAMGIGAYIWNSERELNRQRYQEIHDTIKENQKDIKRIEQNQQEAAVERKEIKTKQASGAVDWNMREARVIDTLNKLAVVDQRILDNLAKLDVRQTVSENTLENNRREWERRAKDIKNHKH